MRQRLTHLSHFSDRLSSNWHRVPCPLPVSPHATLYRAWTSRRSSLPVALVVAFCALTTATAQVTTRRMSTRVMSAIFSHESFLMGAHSLPPCSYTGTHSSASRLARIFFYSFLLQRIEASSSITDVRVLLRVVVICDDKKARALRASHADNARRRVGHCKREEECFYLFP